MIENQPTVYNVPTLYNGDGSVYNGHGVYNMGGGGGDIPFVGEKTNEWLFDINTPDYMTDKIGSVIAEQYYPGTYGDYIDVGYTHGVGLNVQIQEKDYIEIIADMVNYIEDSNHMRFITAGGYYIDYYRAFVIWRGGSYKFWSSYFSGLSPSWSGVNLSNDYYEFKNKKIGVYIKSNSLFDIYLDNELIYSDIPCDILGQNWCVGCSTSNFSKNVNVALKKATIYKNCIPK